MSAVVHFGRGLLGGAVAPSVVALLEQLLLILMIIEILYTLQVSFREHVLVPEPFVLVALIAGIRRILVITAEFGTLADQGESSLSDAGGRRTFMLVCDWGDDPVEALTDAAKRFDLRAASLTGIGAFAAVTLGFFDHARRDYRRRVIREQVEVVSLIGNIALDQGSPRGHAHVVVGRSDGGALGGHCSAGAWPRPSRSPSPRSRPRSRGGRIR